MNPLLGFSAFVVSLLLYLVVARRAGRTVVTHPDHFFLSKGAHDDAQFAASQISYQLQMATVYPFFVFAFGGSWWLAVWNTLFYALGIGLLYAVLPQFMKGHYKLAGSPKTLHSFIANLHNAPNLRQFTAWMSIVGFSGLAAFEIVWGARILRDLFGGNASIYYLSVVILAFYLVLYLWLGGQRGTINTGQYQLVIAYVGIHAIVAWAILQPTVSVSKLDSPIIVPLIFLFGLLMLVSRARVLFQPGRKNLAREQQVSRRTQVLSIIVVISLAGMLVSLCFSRDFFSTAVFAWKPIDTSAKEFRWQLWAFALLPIFFQFVDMTTWQRMASLGGEQTPGLLSAIRNGLKTYWIESPLSWLLPVLLGLCAAKFVNTSVEGDPWDALFKTITAQPGILGALLTIAFVSGVAAVFLSTADALLIAVGYSFSYDVHRRTRNIIDRHSSAAWEPHEVSYVIEKGRTGLTLCFAAIVVLFVVVDIAGGKGRGDTLIGLFLSFFTPMVSFAPAILVPAITKRASNGGAAWLAIGIGSTAGITTGIISVFAGGIWPWVSIIAAFTLSWSIYVIGMLFGTRELEEPHAR